MRAPDASFIARDRLPQGELPVGYLEIIPDLAVEVVWPSDTPREVREKVSDWLRAGTRLVWVIDPATRSVTVYRSIDDFETLPEGGELAGGEVIPGFTGNIQELFAWGNRI